MEYQKGDLVRLVNHREWEYSTRWTRVLPIGTTLRVKSNAEGLGGRITVEPLTPSTAKDWPNHNPWVNLPPENLELV